MAGLVPFGLVGAFLVLAGDPAGWVGVGLVIVILATLGAFTYRTRAP